MTQSAIFAPFFVVIFLTMIVWFYMYARRIPFIQSNNLTPEQLAPTQFARISPPDVSNPSDNLKNLFEVPTLFYVVVLYLYVTRQVDATYVVAAWVFVAFRILHSAVHSTVNIIILRFWLYAASTLTLWFMVIRAGLSALR
jgi:hypothetical protein